MEITGSESSPLPSPRLDDEHDFQNDEEQEQEQVLIPPTVPICYIEFCFLQSESLLHRAVNFVWEAEADFHSSLKKKNKKKKKSVTIKDDHFTWDKSGAISDRHMADDAAILDMKVTARGNNISGGFAQVFLSLSKYALFYIFNMHCRF